MKILHVISSLDPLHGGVTEGVRQLAEASMRLGCTVEAATIDHPASPFLNEFPFQIHALGPPVTHFRYSSRLLPWLMAHIASYDVVVVHALWQYHTVAVRQAALKRDVPYVVYTHGMLDPYFKRSNPFKHAKKWLFWPWGDYRVLRDANAVLFTTEEERLLARHSFWLYSAREVVVNFGTARPTGDAEAQREAFYSRYPELRANRFALFMGRIHPKKGCDLAIEAFARARASTDYYAGWRLVMAGPDQVGWRAELSQKAEMLDFADRIIWTGMLAGDEKWGALRAAEFFFLPSHQENFGMVVAEALACGTPALISDKVNIWREVKEASAGLVAPDTLEGAVALLDKWRSLGAAGEQKMRAQTVPCFELKFEIQQATANLLETLRDVLPASSKERVYAGV